MPSHEQVKEIAAQQVLQPDGSVFSSQSMLFPAKYADVITGPKLLDRYLKYIRETTFSVIRPVSGPHGIQFRLLGSPISILSFAFPELISAPERSEVRLKIVGGVMVQRNETAGTFNFFAMKTGEGVRASVELSDFCPMLLGSRKPSLLRKLLYRFTQATVHEFVTMRFLSTLYHEVTGVKVRATRKSVHLRNGTPI
jgi:hypothetical protein